MGSHPTYRFECSEALYSEVWHQLVISSSSARHQFVIREKEKKGKMEKEKKGEKGKREKGKKGKKEKTTGSRNGLGRAPTSARHQFVIREKGKKRKREKGKKRKKGKREKEKKKK